MHLPIFVEGASMHRLMIKTHSKTGLKYLCYTQREDYLTYGGSGKYWVRHCAEHGWEFVLTEVLFETDDYEAFRNKAIEISKQLKIVESPEWANLRAEEGTGGDTVSGKRWITNGVDERYIDKAFDIPEGWYRGRSPLKCKFKDPELQKELSSRVDRNKNGSAIRKAWAEGKFDKRTGVGIAGENNPAKRPEVRKKISESAKNRFSNPEARKAMSDLAKQRLGTVCPHCHRILKTRAKFHISRCGQNG
jgi:hypothetical protein